MKLLLLTTNISVTTTVSRLHFFKNSTSIYMCYYIVMVFIFLAYFTLYNGLQFHKKKKKRIQLPSFIPNKTSLTILVLLSPQSPQYYPTALLPWRTRTCKVLTGIHNSTHYFYVFSGLLKVSTFVFVELYVQNIRFRLIAH